MGNEIKVGFNLTDFDCASEEITKRIDLEPSEVWIAGEPVLGGARVHKESGWRLELADKNASGIEPLLEDLLAKLEVSAEVIAELTSECLCEITFTVYITEYSPSLHLGRQAVARIARLGAEIDFDVYCLVND